MVRHVVMFTFKDGVTDVQIGEYVANVSRLPSIIPQVRDFRVGRDVGVNPGNFDMVVCGDFDSVDDYLTYRDHPEHQRVVREFGLPIIAQRAAVQFEC